MSGEFDVAKQHRQERWLPTQRSRAQDESAAHRRILQASRAAVCFCIAVFAFDCVVYYLVFLRQFLPASGSDDCVFPFAVVFNVFFVLAIWSYFQAAFSDPGTLPESWRSFCLRAGDDLDVVASMMSPPGWQPGKATLCRKCNFPRPERAHHCSVCRICILRYDHHCPWINNCVGVHNHKFFLLLGIYASLGCLFSFASSLPWVCECLGMFGSTSSQVAELSFSADFILILFCVSNLIFTVMLCMLLRVHMPFAMTNSTTVEENYDNMPNPFEQGSRARNLAQIFGVYGPDWVLPIAPLRPLTDGVIYARFDDLRGHDGLPEPVGNLSAQETEHLWRLRYQFAHPPPQKKQASTDAGPLATLARWWSGDDERNTGALSTVGTILSPRARASQQDRRSRDMLGGGATQGERDGLLLTT